MSIQYSTFSVTSYPKKLICFDKMFNENFIVIVRLDIYKTRQYENTVVKDGSAKNLLGYTFQVE